MKNKKIEFLSQYTNIINEINILSNAYVALYSVIFSVPIATISDMPKGGPGCFDKIPKNLARLEQFQEQIEARKSKLIDVRIAIETAIANIDGARLRMVLYHRYIEDMKWEHICVKMSYEWAQIHRFHSQALELIEVNNDTK